MKISRFREAVGGALVGALAARYNDINDLTWKFNDYVASNIADPISNYDAYVKAFYGTMATEWTGAGLLAAYFIGRPILNQIRQKI